LPHALQLLPGADEEMAARLEKNVQATGPVSRLVAAACTSEDILAALLDGFDVQIHEHRFFRFACDCSRERVREILLALGPGELEKLLAEQGWAEATCAFCNQVYRFGEGELVELIALSRRPEH